MRLFGSERLSNDYEGRCGNCQSLIDDGDKYCRHCGTARGQGAFLPYSNEMYCVYGPPIKALIKCNNCGNKWEERTLGRRYSRFCPECGAGELDVNEEMDF